MKTQAYDLIGDIHGQHDKLVPLLNALGYLPRGNFAGWNHPEGRKVIFLGDYIDRGPKVREVLREVRGMAEAGDALAIMGNHEFNAVLYQMPDGKCAQRAGTRSPRGDVLPRQGGGFPQTNPSPLVGLARGSYFGRTARHAGSDRGR